MESLFYLTKTISGQNPNRDIMLRIAKMSEELGEFSAACLKIAHYKKRDADFSVILDNAIEEACDMYLVCLDIIHKLGISESEFAQRVLKKLPKWEAGIKNFISETTKDK